MKGPEIYFTRLLYSFYIVSSYFLLTNSNLSENNLKFKKKTQITAANIPSALVASCMAGNIITESLLFMPLQHR